MVKIIKNLSFAACVIGVNCFAIGGNAMIDVLCIGGLFVMMFGLLGLIVSSFWEA
jgi:hypothetical protein